MSNNIKYLVEVDSKGAIKSMTEFGKSGENSIKKLDKSNKSVAKSTESLISKYKGLAVVIAAAFAVKGIVSFVKSIMEVGIETENLKVRLKVLTGSVEEANRMFKNMSTLAARVPFEYGEIMEAATNLSGVLKGNVDAVSGWMPLIADLAAATGIGIRETTTQVARMLSAGAASADLFRERGVSAFLGFQSGVTYSVQETQKILWNAWASSESRFRGSTDEMAKTWSGVMSMISDKWREFKQKLADSGLFDTLKDSLKDVDKAMESLVKALSDPDLIGAIQWMVRMFAAIAKEIKFAVIWWYKFFNPTELDKQTKIVGQMRQRVRFAERLLELARENSDLDSESFKKAEEAYRDALDAHADALSEWHMISERMEGPTATTEKTRTPPPPAPPGDDDWTKNPIWNRDFNQQNVRSAGGFAQAWGEDTSYQDRKIMEDHEKGIQLEEESRDRLNRIYGGGGYAQAWGEDTSVQDDAMIELLEKNREAAEEMQNIWDEKVTEINMLFTDLLVDGLFDFIDGTKDAAEAFKAFASSFLKQIAQMIIKHTILNALQNSGGGVGAFFAKFIPSANGNVLQGGFQSFANGGMVTRPTLGLVGEGKYNEAIVPLPDGRSIPVSMKGTGQNIININMNAPVRSKEEAHEYGAIVAREVRKQIDGRISYQRKPGGILNPQPAF